MHIFTSPAVIYASIGKTNFKVRYFWKNILFNKKFLPPFEFENHKSVTFKVQIDKKYMLLRILKSALSAIS